MPRRRTLAAACALALAALASAPAVTITASFAGEITVVDPALGSQFSVGDGFSGEFSLYTNATDGNRGTRTTRSTGSSPSPRLSTATRPPAPTRP